MKASDTDADAYVLNVVADDYESIDMICKDACEWAAEEGKELTPDAASNALLRLMRCGLVDCYRFDAASNAYVVVNTRDPKPFEGYWFMASAQGLQKIAT
jgi:hypothetical protein